MLHEIELNTVSFFQSEFKKIMKNIQNFKKQTNIQKWKENRKVSFLNYWQKKSNILV